MQGTFKQLSIITLFLSTILMSCDIINPPEPIPAYIRIDTVHVVVNDIDKGSALHNLNNIWISVGGENLGVFEMPFEVPTLSTGFHTLTIRAGVKLNGIAASRFSYPFFENYLTDLELRSGEVYTITPVTTYKKDCVFAWMEDFEDAGVAFEYSDKSTVQFSNQHGVLREGRYSGAAQLDSEHRFLEVTSRDIFDLPPQASALFLEFDYQNTNPIEVGMYVIESDGSGVWSSVMLIKANEKWKRIYVDLGSPLSYEDNIKYYRPGFRAEWDQPDSLPSMIYLDNLKMIHF